jgi:hypothetical protein
MFLTLLLYLLGAGCGMRDHGCVRSCCASCRTSSTHGAADAALGSSLQAAFQVSSMHQRAAARLLDTTVR